MDLIDIIAQIKGGRVCGIEQIGKTQVVKILIPEKMQVAKSFVYLMQNEKGHTKIGVSKRPVFREKTLQSEQPEIKMIYRRELENAIQIEKRLHTIYAYWRLRGEWFDLDQHKVDACKNYLDSL